MEDLLVYQEKTSLVFYDFTNNIVHKCFEIIFSANSCGYCSYYSFKFYLYFKKFCEENGYDYAAIRSHNNGNKYLPAVLNLFDCFMEESQRNILTLKIRMKIDSKKQILHIENIDIVGQDTTKQLLITEHEAGQNKRNMQLELIHDDLNEIRSTLNNLIHSVGTLETYMFAKKEFDELKNFKS